MRTGSPLIDSILKFPPLLVLASPPPRKGKLSHVPCSQMRRYPFRGSTIRPAPE
jgi:hypothetical protein